MLIEKKVLTFMVAGHKHGILNVEIAWTIFIYIQVAELVRENEELREEVKSKI